METLDNRQFWRTVYRFNSSYYSGLDTRLYIGERWLDVASALEFTVQELAVPVFGYKSYALDTVLQGVRTIQGNLAMHFIRPMYLFELMERITSGTPTKEEPRGSTDALASSEMDDRARYLQLYSSRSSLISRYWGASEEPDPSYAHATSTEAPIFLTPEPISLVIVYSDPIGRESEAKRFVVDTSYVVQPAEEEPPRAATTRHLEVLSDVTFTGVSRAVDDSGHSIVEVYSFIARSWNDREALNRYRRLIHIS